MLENDRMKHFSRQNGPTGQNWAFPLFEPSMNCCGACVYGTLVLSLFTAGLHIALFRPEWKAAIIGCFVGFVGTCMFPVITRMICSNLCQKAPPVNYELAEIVDEGIEI